MLIPSIDLQNGRVVHLVQGEKLAISTDDLDGWIAKFATFPKVQLIDLDAAMSRGNNDALVRRIDLYAPSGRLHVQVNVKKLIYAAFEK